MTAAPSSTESAVRAEIDGHVGRIVLDRPAAHHALTTEMVDRLEQVLIAWRSEPLKAVTIAGTGGRAFCAGGDIIEVRRLSLAGESDAIEDFFATEYRVNQMLGAYAHPVVALIDGICMGGGLGLSVHGPFRVVTERALLAMPETSIGFFPDVGASHFLPRLPGYVGTYLGLTGARLDAADALHTGLATHLVPSDLSTDVPDLIAASPEPIDRVLRDLEGPRETGGLASHRAAIDHCFAPSQMSQITERLQAEGTDWAGATLAALARCSPASLDLTLELLVAGRQRTLAACLAAELVAARTVAASADFVEGVGARLVDKDREPQWAGTALTA
ncbi:enoyl-CoA hydratase [Aeromicrobium sp. A1-2]|uniref:enoyl-CoA hydratase/isomerase family protein n=1 Tax=Aeromicrobium sp. A1-2 TaxID=2107713 RepID=UPI000E4B1C6D|nr:enoyl-CoA hydratase/isomerase family protein [Aeromicrobium sp. A1-2]AXT86620.1 enoyl-CoA hydratase [Aeromicrobium sp. A1-2]